MRKGERKTYLSSQVSIKIYRIFYVPKQTSPMGFGLVCYSNNNVLIKIAVTATTIINLDQKDY